MKKYIPESKDYWVDEQGNVYKGSRCLKKNKMDNGYESVSISYLDNRPRKLFYVHRLIAEMFIPNPENKRFVNHKNSNRMDNRADNLEWCTHFENMQHAHAVGAFRKKTGQHHHAIFTDETIRHVCKLLSEGRRDKDIENLTGVTRHSVSDIRKRKVWYHISCDYEFVTPRKRRLSDATAEWVCRMIVEGKAPKEIEDLSDGKVLQNMVRDIKLKKSYADISDKYF